MRQMLFKVEDDISFCVRNLKSGNEVSTAKFSGQLEINGRIFPFILQSRSFGWLKDMKVGFMARITILALKQEVTKYSKEGYILLQINLSPPKNPDIQMGIYIKDVYMQGFLAAIVMG